MQEEAVLTRRIFNWQRLVAFLLLALLAGLIAWRIMQKRSDLAAMQDMRASRRGRPASVETAEVSLRDIETVFVTAGTVEAVESVVISPRASGIVEYLAVDEGDSVRQGQVLVRIDPSELEAEVRRQQAAVAESRSRLSQAELTQGGADTAVMSQVSVQEAAVSVARAELRRAEQKRDAQVEVNSSSLSDAIARINSAKAVINNARAGISVAQANLTNSTARYDRAMTLLEKGYISTQEVENARTALLVQQSQVEAAKGQLVVAEAGLASAEANYQTVLQETKMLGTATETDLRTAQAKLTQAEASLKSATANIAQTGAYRKNLQALQAGVAAAQASLDSARVRLGNSVLRSPIDGVVTSRNLDRGSLASVGQQILTVQTAGRLWVDLSVPEDVVARLVVGMKAGVSVDALGKESMSGRVAQLNPAADLKSRQFGVKVILDNPDKKVKPGMFAKVSLVIEKAAGVPAVPLEAVRRTKGGASTVMVVDAADKAIERAVTTGAADADWIAVLHGLTVGEKVIVMSASTVRPGQQIGGGGPRGGKGGPRPQSGAGQNENSGPRQGRGGQG